MTAATGTIGRHLVRALAEADVPFRALVRDARTAGVSWVVKMSAWQPGPDTKLSVRAHWEIEQHLKASGLAWTSLQPTGYMQNFFTGEGGFTHGGALEGPYGAGRVAYIDAYDIAARAAALLTGPPRGGETYALTGPEAPTHEEIARMVRG
ncbi:SDR family oxidoreductase [Streptomyces kanamyceticus]|uniref:SDR family oxidoreductase n=1 Tax=Streptomyces kanamyceticus TaxID=1967 RepID=UPI001F0B48F6|nr:NmrA family NAD(P)-binding protein [Streptomyces kanamyceticus]